MLREMRTVCQGLWFRYSAIPCAWILCVAVSVCMSMSIKVQEVALEAQGDGGGTRGTGAKVRGNSTPSRWCSADGRISCVNPVWYLFWTSHGEGGVCSKRSEFGLVRFRVKNESLESRDVIGCCTLKKKHEYHSTELRIWGWKFRVNRVEKKIRGGDEGPGYISTSKSGTFLMFPTVGLLSHEHESLQGLFPRWAN
jgi:hypothetical protein